MMDTLGWVLIGAFAFFAVIVFLIVAYLLWKRFSSLVKFEKVISGGKSNVYLQAFIPIRKATIEDNASGGTLVFVRENIKAGEKLEFVYPQSKSSAKLIAEGEENFSLEAAPRLEKKEVKKA